MKSEFFKLNLSDFTKGLIVAVATAVLTSLYAMIEKGDFVFDKADIKLILLSGLGAGIAYLLKNLTTNSDGQYLTTEKPKENDKD